MKIVDFKGLHCRQSIIVRSSAQFNEANNLITKVYFLRFAKIMESLLGIFFASGLSTSRPLYRDIKINGVSLNSPHGFRVFASFSSFKVYSAVQQLSN